MQRSSGLGLYTLHVHTNSFFHILGAVVQHATAKVQQHAQAKAKAVAEARAPRSDVERADADYASALARVAAEAKRRQAEADAAQKQAAYDSHMAGAYGVSLNTLRAQIRAKVEAKLAQATS